MEREETSVSVFSHTPTRGYVWGPGLHLLDVLLKLAICEDLIWRVSHLMGDGVQQLLIQRLQLQTEIKWELSWIKKKKRDILCEVRAHEWWYLQLLVSSRFFFRVFIFFKILKESSHMFTFYPMCEVNYVILWLHFRFSCHIPSFLAPSLSTPVCVRAQVTS